MGVVGTCKLCGQADVELRDSHLLPKAAYKILRKSQDRDSPIKVDREIALVTDSQIRARGLCETCEDRLNKYGESWLLRHCHRGADGFRLRELLSKAKPALIPKTARQFCLVQSPGRFILSGDAISEMIINHEGKLFGRSGPVGSLANSIETQNVAH